MPPSARCATPSANSGAPGTKHPSSSGNGWSQATSRCRQARPGRARPRREDHRARAPRRGDGGDLHRAAPDAGADRGDRDPGGRGRGRHLDPLGRAHDARAAYPRASARKRGGRRPRPGGGHHPRGRRRGAAPAGGRRRVRARRPHERDHRLPPTSRPRMSVALTREGAVAVVTIDRPEALNALDVATLTELRDRLAELAEDAGARAIVLTGAGGKAFVAGADIKYMSGLDPQEAKAWGALGHEATRLLETMPKPTIAAIDGF